MQPPLMQLPLMRIPGWGLSKVARAAIEALPVPRSHPARNLLSMKAGQELPIAVLVIGKMTEETKTTLL